MSLIVCSVKDFVYVHRQQRRGQNFLYKEPIINPLCRHL